MGRNYINFKKHFLSNLIYPNARLSIIYFVNRKIKSIIKIKIMINDIIISPLKILSDNRGKSYAYDEK